MIAINACVYISLLCMSINFLFAGELHQERKMTELFKSSSETMLKLLMELRSKPGQLSCAYKKRNLTFCVQL